MLAPIARISLRYAAGMLVAWGMLTSDFGRMLAGDPDALALVELGMGFVVALVAEGYYWLAKRWGWAT